MKFSLREALGKVRRILADIMFPSGLECLVCGAASNGLLLCRDCRESLAFSRIAEPRCPVCSGPMQGNVCPLCVDGWKLRGSSAWYHTGVPRKLVHCLKFSGYTQAADLLAEGMAEAAGRLMPEGDTVVTWVPMRPEKLRDRGVDHARLLAEKTASLLGLECDQLLDNRSRESRGESQVGRSREQRQSRELLFVPRGNTPARVLLVDDVMTTGATLLAASSPLELAGADVCFLTATRTPKN